MVIFCLALTHDAAPNFLQDKLIALAERAGPPWAEDASGMN